MRQLRALLRTLRAEGVTEYSGPVPGRDISCDPLGPQLVMKIAPLPAAAPRARRGGIVRGPLDPDAGQVVGGEDGPSYGGGAVAAPTMGELRARARDAALEALLPPVGERQ